MKKFNQKTIIVFSDAATSAQTMNSVGGFLCLDQPAIEQYADYSLELLFANFADKIVYRHYHSKKSTWSEIKTAIDAFEAVSNQFGSTLKIELYTDCQNLCDLLNKRKIKLEQNNFMTRSGNILQNAELYKELFAIADRINIKTFKIKGHAKAEKRTSVYERIFSILDKLCRKQLRIIANKSNHQ